MLFPYLHIYHWLLLASCVPFLPLHIHSIPVHFDGSAGGGGGGDDDGRNNGPSGRQCQHSTIPDLIRTSPVILKALGARIFTDYDIREASDIDTDAFADEKESQIFTIENVIYHQSDDEEKTVANRKKIAEASSTTTVKEESESIVITLTPETIYKGASLLKVSPASDNGESASRSESSYQYKGQLNATLEPLACFDGNILRLLPTELIIFGKLISEQQPDVLRISINGLHRWSSQFENHIWKYLGWDDWSDFTLCSVTCGKGVQQRFRRCLLDNPMIDLNMNVNRYNGIIGSSSIDIDMVVEDIETNRDKAVTGGYDDLVERNTSSKREQNYHQYHHHYHDHRTHHHHHHHAQHQQQKHHRLKSYTTTATIATTENNDNDDVGNFDATDTSTNDNEIKKSTVIVSDDGSNSISSNKLKKRRKRKKASKSLSTMSCEGYNIEQRNCNTFECSDDLSDLLKFYKKFLMPEDLTTVGVVAAASAIIVGASNSSLPSSTISSATTADGGSSSIFTAPSPSLPISSTPSNMGYVKSWRNTFNFTLMMTLRVKNDSKSASTIFSIRNATHNLYVEPSLDGLRLYQERDGTTEMLSVKFNLYDNRWHQIAISIQNGDFISIFVDCLWTNSFVVSKRLFSLPDDADVEIGRGFNGELQQLLVLPENQERHQCSSQRTSINEVKRYIIDTFIDDYGN